jgi:hypothetical protein
MTTTSKTLGWHGLFGAPPVLQGEDVRAYDELFGRACAAVKPGDVIDEMLIVDVVSLEWEILRWRRAKANMIRRQTREALKSFLVSQLDYNVHYQKFFERDLTEILQANLPEDQPKGAAAALARACARNESDAVDKVNEILDRIGKHMDGVLDCALARKADELTSKYDRREPAAVKLVDGLLAAAGTSIDSLMLDALTEQLDDIERIDRLITLAENRRDASLREIDRRRAVLGGRLGKSLQEVKENQPELIDSTPVEAKNHARQAIAKSRPTGKMLGQAPGRGLIAAALARRKMHSATA